MFDCFGAGQIVTQHTFGGATWQTDAELIAPMTEAFLAVRQLQEMRRFLSEVILLEASADLTNAAEALERELADLTTCSSAELAAVEWPVVRARVDEVLRAASGLVRLGRPQDR